FLSHIGKKVDKGGGELRRGQLVYRVYGGASPKWGASWTPFNPQAIGVKRYRSVAGLPDSNAGTHLVIARLRDPSSIQEIKGANSFESKKYGVTHPGGLLEYVIPDSENALDEVDDFGVYPNF